MGQCRFDLGTLGPLCQNARMADVAHLAAMSGSLVVGVAGDHGAAVDPFFEANASRPADRRKGFRTGGGASAAGQARKTKEGRPS